MELALLASLLIMGVANARLIDHAGNLRSASVSDHTTNDAAMGAINKEMTVEWRAGKFFGNADLGIDYLGAGYNLMYGNPQGDSLLQMDPGFRHPIIRLEFDQTKRTASKKALLPAGAYSLPMNSCYQTEESKKSSSVKNYGDELASEVGLKVGVAGIGAFEGSVGFKDFAQDVANTKAERYTFTSYCLERVAGFYEETFDTLNVAKDVQMDMLLLPSLKLTPEETLAAEALDPATTVDCINEAFKGLCETNAADMLVRCAYECKLAKWTTFFDEYGTHIISKLFSGGKLITEVKVSKEANENIARQGINIGLAVKAKFGKTQAAVSGSVDRSSEVGSKLAVENVSAKTIVFGGKPPQDVRSPAGFGEWAASVSLAPMPVRYSLTPMAMFITKVTNLTQVDYDTAFNRYGQWVHDLRVRGELNTNAPIVAEEPRTIFLAESTLTNEPPVYEKGSFYREYDGKDAEKKLNTKPEMDFADAIVSRSRLVSPNGLVALELLSSGGLIVTYKGAVLWWNQVYKEFGNVIYYSKIKNYPVKCWSKPVMKLESDSELSIAFNDKCWEPEDAELYDPDSRQWGFNSDGDSAIPYASFHSWSNGCTSPREAPGLLEVMNNGNVVIFSESGSRVWETGSTDGNSPILAPLLNFGKGKCLAPINVA